MAGAEGGSGSVPPAVEIPVAGGVVPFSEGERSCFDLAFRVVDVDDKDVAGGREAAAFLRRSGLEDPVLREIWRIASGGKSAPALNRSRWLVACKLVALQQNRGELSLRMLVANDDLPMPDFGFGPRRVAPQQPAAVTSADALRIQVEGSEQRGSGLTRHTVYRVHMKTILRGYPRAEALVYRRFSDFAWLHDRLTSAYPGTVLPPLPEKRAMGRMEEEFVVERRAALERYLREAARHALLRTSHDLAAFLTASARGFDALKSLHAQSAPGAWDAVVASVSAWRYSHAAASATAALPPDARVDAESVAAVGSASNDHRLLDEVIRTARALVAARKAHAYQVARVGAYLGELGGVDRTASAATARLENAAGGVLEQAAERMQDQGNRDVATLVTPLVFVSGKAAGLSQVAANREAALTRLARASALHHAAKKAHAQRRAHSGVGSGASDPEIVRTQMDVVEAQRAVAAASRGLREEGKRLQRERVGEMKGVLRTAVVEQVRYYREMQRLWAGLLKRHIPGAVPAPAEQPAAQAAPAAWQGAPQPAPGLAPQTAPRMPQSQSQSQAQPQSQPQSHAQARRHSHRMPYVPGGASWGNAGASGARGAAGPSGFGQCAAPAPAPAPPRAAAPAPPAAAQSPAAHAPTTAASAGTTRARPGRRAAW